MHSLSSCNVWTDSWTVHPVFHRIRLQDFQNILFLYTSLHRQQQRRLSRWCYVISSSELQEAFLWSGYVLCLLVQQIHHPWFVVPVRQPDGYTSGRSVPDHRRRKSGSWAEHLVRKSADILIFCSHKLSEELYVSHCRYWSLPQGFPVWFCFR